MLQAIQIFFSKFLMLHNVNITQQNATDDVKGKAKAAYTPQLT
uniref:Uncharacterized protein n=1 Tax=Arundo donax TaxID=35708 RepID=A0A0A9FBC4_ARUDO